jgi:hypothetical protein
MASNEESGFYIEEWKLFICLYTLEAADQMADQMVPP